MSQAQCNKILRHIREAGNITNKEAIVEYSIAALPRRIADLEEMGFMIDRQWATHPTTGQRYVRYKFAEGSPKTMEELKTNDRRAG